MEQKLQQATGVRAALAPHPERLVSKEQNQRWLNVWTSLTGCRQAVRRTGSAVDRQSVCRVAGCAQRDTYTGAHRPEEAYGMQSASSQASSPAHLNYIVAITILQQAG